MTDAEKIIALTAALRRASEVLGMLSETRTHELQLAQLIANKEKSVIAAALDAVED